MAQTEHARNGFPNDRELVVAFQGGNRVAYTEIYRLYRPLVRRICFRLLGNPDDAEEAAQESLLRVYQGLRTFNGRYRLQAWVARIATNVCLDEIRARARRPQNGVHLDEDIIDLTANGTNGHGHGNGKGNGHEQDPLEVLELQAERTRIHDVLRSLPEEQRVALVMRAIEGRSHQELAEVLGSSPVRTKALVHRAKRTFRRSWTRLPVFVPFIGLARLPGRLRKGFGTESTGPVAGAPSQAAASQAAVAATDLAAGASHAATAMSGAATAVSQAVTATPAVVTVVQSTGDRLVAGITAVVLAAGVGAVTVSQDRPAPVQIEVVSAPGTSPDPSLDTKPRSAPPPAPQPPADETDQTPAPTPSGDPAETPPPGPSPEPSPSPSPSSEPAPAPGYSLGFSWSGETSDSCGCSPSSSLRGEDVHGNAGDHVRFRQEAVGVVIDSSGHAPWRVTTNYEGQLGETGGEFKGLFSLEASDGTRSYAITSADVSMTATPEGGYRTLIFATYAITNEATWREGLPRAGTAQVVLEWWSDGTSLYRAEFSLNESS